MMKRIVIIFALAVLALTASPERLIDPDRSPGQAEARQKGRAGGFKAQPWQRPSGPKSRPAARPGRSAAAQPGKRPPAATRPVQRTVARPPLPTRPGPAWEATACNREAGPSRQLPATRPPRPPRCSAAAPTAADRRQTRPPSGVSSAHVAPPGFASTGLPPALYSPAPLAVGRILMVSAVGLVSHCHRRRSDARLCGDASKPVRLHQDPGSGWCFVSL